MATLLSLQISLTLFNVYVLFLHMNTPYFSQPVDSFVSGLMLFLLSVFLQLFLKLFIFICISHPVLYVL